MKNQSSWNLAMIRMESASRFNQVVLTCQWWRFESRRRTCDLLLTCQLVEFKVSYFLIYVFWHRDWTWPFWVSSHKDFRILKSRQERLPVWIWLWNHIIHIQRWHWSVTLLLPYCSYYINYLYRCLQFSQVIGQATVGKRFVSIHRKNRRLISLTVLSVLWIFIPAAEYDARLHPNKHIPKSHTFKLGWF